MKHTFVYIRVRLDRYQGCGLKSQNIRSTSIYVGAKPMTCITGNSPCPVPRCQSETSRVLDLRLTPILLRGSLPAVAAAVVLPVAIPGTKCRVGSLLPGPLPISSPIIRVDGYY